MGDNPRGFGRAELDEMFILILGDSDISIRELVMFGDCDIFIRELGMFGDSDISIRELPKSSSGVSMMEGADGRKYWNSSNRKCM